MKTVISGFFLFLTCTIGISQKSLNRKSSIYFFSDISLQRMDVFYNIGVKKRIKYFEFGAVAGMGIEKTFFQRCFSPHAEFFTFYNWIQLEMNRKKGIIFGPGFLYSNSSYKFVTTYNYNDFFLAYQFAVGNKFKFLNQAGYGLMIENFNGYHGKIINVAYNYFVKLGVSYAFN